MTRPHSDGALDHTDPAVDGSPDTTIPDEWVEAAGVAVYGPAWNPESYQAVHMQNALAATVPLVKAAERERIATAIEATDHPHDVFLTGDVGTWATARRMFAALARAGGDHE